MGKGTEGFRFFKEPVGLKALKSILLYIRGFLKSKSFNLDF